MNRAEIADCLLFSEACYLTKFEAQNMVDTIGASLIAAIRVGTAHCYLFKKDTTVYFATRGTDIRSLSNLLMDTRALPVFEPGVGFVHRGFLNWADLLWEEVGAYLTNDGFAADKVVFCGHSAGGAASNILAVRSSMLLKSSGHDKPWLVTFGSPRTGTGGFSRVVAKLTNHVRVTHNNDPVAHVPIWPLFLHASGTRLHITANGRMLENPGWWPILKDVPDGILSFAWQFIKDVFMKRSVLKAVWCGLETNDHFISNYRRRFRVED